MLVQLPVLLVTVLAAIVPSSCTPTRETNADRLARGLPPLPPKFARSIPVAAREPTPVQVAKRGRPSSLPPVSFDGCLQVRDSWGKVLGSVQNVNASTTIGGINKSGQSDHDLKVSFTAPRSGAGPFDITVTNPTFDAPFYVGASTPAGSNKARLNSVDTLTFTNVQQTPANSAPQVSTYDSTALVESAIWSINPFTKELTAEYVNVDSSSVQVSLAYNMPQNSLFFVADIKAYNKANAGSNSVSQVKLFLA